MADAVSVENEGGSIADEDSILVVVFFVGNGNPNAKIDQHIFEPPKGFAVAHGQYWVARLGPQPIQGFRQPPMHLLFEVSPDRLCRACGTHLPPNPDLVELKYQLAQQDTWRSLFNLV
jgi:hypothetical protein